MDDAQRLYDQINAAWDAAGLMHARVMDTPRRNAAIEAVRRYYHEECKRVGEPMGPKSDDTWFIWMHRLSHTLEDGHTVAHAKREKHLVDLVLKALSGPG